MAIGRDIVREAAQSRPEAKTRDGCLLPTLMAFTSSSLRESRVIAIAGNRIQESGRHPSVAETTVVSTGLAAIRP